MADPNNPNPTFIKAKHQRPEGWKPWYENGKGLWLIGVVVLLAVLSFTGVVDVLAFLEG